ncbi:MAG: molybdopterin-dependent oxidoreductase, partial [Gammaproteobacteria bacterium]|nr:molybdopterin-dependent oxidoreductase [Gammaproteobacteria bacterium]
RQFAREYAKAKAPGMRIGVALERHYGGGQTIRAVCCMAGITGAWREVGGGIYQMPVWAHPYAFDVICRPEWIPDGTRVINALQIGRALTGEMDLDIPIKSFMCWNANPVTQAPETDKIVKGLMREDMFVVSAEHFVSDTASYADIVLPASMGSEMEDIILSWGHNFLTYNAACTESPGEAVPNMEIFRRLAERMGFDDEQFKWSDSECLEHFIDWASPACEGFDLETLRKDGYVRLNLGHPDERAPHAEGNWPTPSGKLELRASGAEGGNFVAGPFRQMYDGFQPGEALDPLPDYVPSRETWTTNPELAKQYPLNIVSPKSHGFLNSCYANMDHKIKGQGEQFVLINEADAKGRGISEGDTVRVFNGRGAFEGEAKITDDVNAGVVVATLGYWRQLNRGTVNSISSAEFVNMGHAPSFSDNLVQVERAG